jgi:hypothetical protein
MAVVPPGPEAQLPPPAETPGLDFSDLSALFINTTLTRSPGVSHIQLLVDASATIMAKHGVRVDQFRAVDDPIATGIYSDMREHGWATDAWLSCSSEC